MSESWLDQKECAVCGERFTVLYPHLWRYKRGTRFLCSWKCLRTFDGEGENDMYTKTKADGTPARKPGRKKKEQTPADQVIIPAEQVRISAEQAKTPDEQVKFPSVKVETAQDVAWSRIMDLAWAIRNVKDIKQVNVWAQEITWQCTLIEAMSDDGQG